MSHVLKKVTDTRHNCCLCSATFRCYGDDEDLPDCMLDDQEDAEEYCGIIRDDSNKGAFKKCIKEAGATANDFFDDCKYDICENQGDDDLMLEIACESISGFAEVCEDLGFVIDWREDAGCGWYLITSLF